MTIATLNNAIVINTTGERGFVRIPRMLTIDQSAFDPTPEPTGDARPPMTRSLDDNGFSYRRDAGIAGQVFAVLWSNPAFGQLIEIAAQRALIPTNTHLVEIRQDTHKGLNWHVGYYSFSYTFPDDYGATLWAPLDPITVDQRGGMQYIPRDQLDGRFLYAFSTWHFEMLARLPADPDYVQKTLSNDYMVNAACDLIESSVPREHIWEDTFDVGDAFLFDKYVLHRSSPLRPGPLKSRRALVFRFVDSSARFDRVRFESSLQHLYKSALAVGGVEKSNTVHVVNGEPRLKDPFIDALHQHGSHGERISDIISRFE